MTEENHGLEQAKAQFASISEMVVALEVDYDRMEELKDEFLAAFNEQQVDEDGDSAHEALDVDDVLFKEWLAVSASDDLEEFNELLAAAGDCENQDAARDRIQEDPLSVEVRSGWYTPGDEPQAPEEFQILLCTGGPAVRIRGELDENCRPDRAWLEYQDWGTSRSDHYVLGGQETLLTYCREFYFGG